MNDVYPLREGMLFRIKTRDIKVIKDTYITLLCFSKKIIVNLFSDQFKYFIAIPAVRTFTAAVRNPLSPIRRERRIIKHNSLPAESWSKSRFKKIKQIALERTVHISFSHKLGYADCYIIEKDVDPTTLALQESEVTEVKLATLDEILQMIDDGVFIPYYESLIRLMFDMRSGYGTHRRPQDGKK
jgi:hypothetical protein